MLFSISKLLVILILVQSVISVEFYKSKRVRPKYKEIRRQYSLKINQENVDSASVNPIQKELDQEQKVGSVQSRNDKKLSLTTSTSTTTPKYDEASTSNLTLMSEQEHDVIMSTEPNFEEKDEIVEKSIEVDDISKNEQPSIITTTVKPKTRPFNLRIMKNGRKNPLNTAITTNESLESDRPTNNKRPSILSTSTIKPKIRTFNVRTLGNIVGKIQNQTRETLLVKNVNKDVASVSNGAPTEKQESSSSAGVVIKKNKPLNIRRFGNSGPKVENNLAETIGNLRENQRKVLGGNIRNTQGLKTKLASSNIKPLRRTLAVYSLKNKKENLESNPDDESDKGQTGIDNEQPKVDNKFSLTSTTITPKMSSTEKNEESSTYATVYPEISIEESSTAATVNPKISSEESSISATVDSKILSTEKNISVFSRLGSVENEEKSHNNAVETTINRNQEKSIISNVKKSGDIEKPTVIPSLKGRRRPLNIRVMKNTKTEIQPVDDDTVNQSKISSRNQQIIEMESSDTTIGTINEIRPTTHIYPSKTNEGNNNSKLHETDEKSDQDKVSSGEDYKPKPGDKQSAQFPKMSQPKRRTLRLESLIISDTNIDEKKTLHDNVDTENSNSNRSPVIISKRLNLNAATPALGSERFITLTTQRKIRVQDATSDSGSSLFDGSSNGKSDSVRQVKKGVARTSQLNENNYQQTTPYYEQLEKTTHNTFIPIVGLENYVYAYNGDYHYSYEGGDGTKAFERGELKSADGLSNASGVVGGFSYKDKDGKDISLSYTAGEDGYRPVGAHLPTPPPIPPAIQRVLRILATKTTPEPVTESIKRYH